MIISLAGLIDPVDLDPAGGGGTRLGSFPALDPWTAPGDPPLPKRRPFRSLPRGPLVDMDVGCPLGTFTADGSLPLI